MYKRFKWNPELRLDERELLAPIQPAKTGRIFVGSTIDLFHPAIPSEWIQRIIEVCGFVGGGYGNDRFIFVTKFPARYADFDFPKNCWLGTTVTRRADNHRLDTLIKHRRGKNVLFVSCEPLLGRVWFSWVHWEYLEWLIAGALTGPKAKQHPPEKAWLDYMKLGCRNWDTPLFLKNNLHSVWGNNLIQEFPKEPA
jgi:protein gp37